MIFRRWWSRLLSKTHYSAGFFRSERGSVGPGTTRRRRAISNKAGEMSKCVLVGCWLVDEVHLIWVENLCSDVVANFILALLQPLWIQETCRSSETLQRGSKKHVRRSWELHNSVGWVPTRQWNSFLKGTKKAWQLQEHVSIHTKCHAQHHSCLNITHLPGCFFHFFAFGPLAGALGPCGSLKMMSLRIPLPRMWQSWSSHLARDHYTAQLTIRLWADNPAHPRSLLLELTDANDLLFYHSLALGESDFHALRSEQRLLVDFQSFPEQLADLLRRCASEGGQGSKMVASLECTGAGESRLNIVESTNFRELIHIDLRLRQGSDEVVKKHLAKKTPVVPRRTWNPGAAPRRLWWCFAKQQETGGWVDNTCSSGGRRT